MQHHPTTLLHPHLAQCTGRVCEQREGQALCFSKRLVGCWAVAADAEHVRTHVLEGCILITELARLFCGGLFGHKYFRREEPLSGKRGRLVSSGADNTHH